MLRRMNEERGVALVVAMLVMTVVMLLSITVVAQSIHELDASGNDRRRLQSVNAAEAGTNAWYEYIETADLDSFNCAPISQALDTEPGPTSFTATPTFYAADATTVMSCPFSSTSYPSYVKVESTGVSGGVQRSFESYVRLSPIAGGGFGAAILSSNAASFSNSFDVFGDVGYDGNIYVLSGNLTMGNSGHVRGTIYVPAGTATLSNSARIEGDLWANGTISMSNTASVGGNGTSSTGNISGSNSAAITGNAKAAGTISGVTVGGTKTPSTPSGPPPTQAFPQVTWVPANWSGYTVSTYSGATACTSARTSITGAWSGNRVIRITGATPCTLAFSNNTTVNVNGNLAIITDWGITMTNQSNWNGATTVKKAYFISTWGGACGSGASSKTVSTANNTNFNAFVNPIFYSPCTVSMNNSSNFKGQVIGGTVSIANNFNMTYQEVLIPGVDYGLSGFSQDIAYVREI